MPLLNDEPHRNPNNRPHLDGSRAVLELFHQPPALATINLSCADPTCWIVGVTYGGGGGDTGAAGVINDATSDVDARYAADQDAPGREDPGGVRGRGHRRCGARTDRHCAGAGYARPAQEAVKSNIAQSLVTRSGSRIWVHSVTRYGSTLSLC